MLKYVAPLERRLHHLARPHVFRVHPDDQSDLSNGQRIAEQMAASIGSWRFISAQAGVMAVWVLINTLAVFHVIQYDAYPFVFLNLAMSAEAAFTGPILLIAASVGALRDHKQADRIEHLAAQNRQLNERIASLEEQVVGRLDAVFVEAQSAAKQALHGNLAVHEKLKALEQRIPAPRRRKIAEKAAP